MIASTIAICAFQDKRDWFVGEMAPDVPLSDRVLSRFRNAELAGGFAHDEAIRRGLPLVVWPRRRSAYTPEVVDLASWRRA